MPGPDLARPVRGGLGSRGKQLVCCPTSDGARYPDPAVTLVTTAARRGIVRQEAGAITDLAQQCGDRPDLTPVLLSCTPTARLFRNCSNSVGVAVILTLHLCSPVFGRIA